MNGPRVRAMLADQIVASLLVVGVPSAATQPGPDPAIGLGSVGARLHVVLAVPVKVESGAEIARHEEPEALRDRGRTGHHQPAIGLKLQPTHFVGRR